MSQSVSNALALLAGGPVSAAEEDRVHAPSRLRGEAAEADPHGHSALLLCFGSRGRAGAGGSSPRLPTGKNRPGPSATRCGPTLRALSASSPTATTCVVADAAGSPRPAHLQHFLTAIAVNIGLLSRQSPGETTQLKQQQRPEFPTESSSVGLCSGGRSGGVERVVPSCVPPICAAYLPPLGDVDA